MRLRNCLGMIWSVSTLGRSRGTAWLLRTLMGCISVNLKYKAKTDWGLKAPAVVVIERASGSFAALRMTAKTSTEAKTRTSAKQVLRCAKDDKVQGFGLNFQLRMSVKWPVMAAAAAI